MCSSFKSIEPLFFDRQTDTHTHTDKHEYSIVAVHSQRQILGRGNLPQDSAPVCINIGINQAFCVTASDWSPITSA